MKGLPKPYEKFKKNYEEIWKAYDHLGEELHKGGPLEKKTRELVKLGIAVGARMEGAVHAHTRLALEAGASTEEIHHVVLLAMTTIGFPNMMAALTWVDDILQ